MAGGAFMQGFAGGVSAGRDAKDRKKRTDALEKIASDGGGSIQKARGILGLDGMPQQGTNFNPAAGGAAGTPIPHSDDDRMTLAKTLQAEAGGEGYDGMIAAGAVINNRVNSGRYGGGKLRDVIMKPGQFSAWNSVTGYANGEGGLDMVNMRPNDDALRAADALLSGGYQDPTGGATHYYNPSVATPKWGQQAGGQWQKIGNHIFGNADGRRGAGTDPAPQQKQAPKREAPADEAPMGERIARSIFGDESTAARMARAFYNKDG